MAKPVAFERASDGCFIRDSLGLGKSLFEIGQRGQKHAGDHPMFQEWISPVQCFLEPGSCLVCELWINSFVSGPEPRGAELIEEPVEIQLFEVEPAGGQQVQQQMVEWSGGVLVNHSKKEFPVFANILDGGVGGDAFDGEGGWDALKEIYFPESILKFFQLGFGPLVLSQALPNRLHADVDDGHSDQLRDDERLVLN